MNRQQRGGDVVDAYLTPVPAVTDPTENEPADELAVLEAECARVRQRRSEVDTAEELLSIQQRDRSHEVDTPKVRRARAKATEAGKLRRWRGHADAVALRDGRIRLGVTVAALFAAVCALGWSTASVQVTAAGTAPMFSTEWWLAFLVEPLISVGLLATIAVQAYAAMRGLTVAPDGEHGRTLRATQRWLLGLTVILNTWPYLTPLWTGAAFDPIQVVVHLVGPIVAVRMIHSLPAMWAVLESLPLPESATDTAEVAPTDAGHTVSSPTVASEPVAPARPLRAAGSKPIPPRRSAASLEQLTGRLQAAVARGEDVDPSSATSIRDHLGIGMDRARALRDRWPNNAVA